MRALMLVVVALLAGCGRTEDGAGQTVRVAVATNFRSTLDQLASRFEAETGVPVQIRSGSTGQLYAQIRAGAPLDVLLAADRDRPARLHAEGLTVSPPVTFAIGRLALVGSGVVAGRDLRDTLLALPGDGRLAIANPEVAPYGAAAMQVLGGLNLLAQLEARLVRGENVGQAFQFTTSGAAQLGLVALAQARQAGATTIAVPPDLHEPIRQDAVVLAGATRNHAVRFVEWLRSDTARGIISAAGYSPLSARD